ncbi:hypothetical protein A33Q_0105 [Indibacter alkaliphilus LW1]|jgi:predicted membrane protein|uniref:Cell wall-active antibiotics response LiaF-like C-terminal domain-containing protein n=1 Tax=Indibacter alkaliphilus (strain CCUG 57479 / KCTC 22604 / LW1) TaxID=1189612 RepID=S2ECW5_INDAL|nr:DUF5668 domain-containing protein [Indibacter alkaliphilus]EPA00234.1 hypothetical protein A33Q_0105 [Indibacter alkaliphilus LW1]
MAKSNYPAKNNDITVGVILVLVGGVILLRTLGIWFPSWFTTWPMILIAVGLIVSIKSNFKSGFGLFMIAFGGVFLLVKNFNLPFNIFPYVIPVGLIALGIYLIIKRNSDRRIFEQSFSDSMKKFDESMTGLGSGMGTSEDFSGTYKSTDHADYIDAQALFTGIERRVMSKNLKGGKVSAIFGGTDIDLTQADLAEGAAINIEVAFGGVKLIVPSNWDLQINVTNIFAGVEDKRMFQPVTSGETKTLRIYGSVIFGGVEIKSF